MRMVRYCMGLGLLMAFVAAPNAKERETNQATADEKLLYVAMPQQPQELSMSPMKQSHAPLQYMGLFMTRTIQTNLVATGILDDQLVGRLYGENGSTTQRSGQTYMEQRALAFLTYSPLSVSGKARLKTAFEVDFTYGDTANTVGSNSGGAINGDQVNLQTKRLMVELDLSDHLKLAIGLQPLTDGAYNATQSRPDNLISGGGRLLFWGTDAAGVNLFWDEAALKLRLGGFLLNANQSSEADDVRLFLADGEILVAHELTLGTHLWYLSDRSRERSGGVESPIARYTGATRADLGPDTADADISWAGIDLSYNRGRVGGPFSLDVAGFVNFGRFEVRPGACRDGQGDLRCPRGPSGTVSPFDASPMDLLAFLVDAQLGYRWGRGDWDLLALNALFSTGDNHPEDRTLSAPITGNAYATPGSLYAHHRAILILPDARAINRHVGVAYDVGNLGYGLAVLSASASGDLIAETLNLKGSVIYVGAGAKPQDTGTRTIGVESNVELTYRFAPFLWLGVQAAKARLGRFIESAERIEVDPPSSNEPWMVGATLTWLQL